MNQQALSGLIWSVENLLRGDFKQSEYGRVILPFTVLRRLDCVLAQTKAAVLAEHRDKAQAGLLYLVVEKFAHIELHPRRVDNVHMGLVFEELIRKFAEFSSETTGEHFTPRELIRLLGEFLEAEQTVSIDAQGKALERVTLFPEVRCPAVPEGGKVKRVPIARVFRNEDFGYRSITIERPLRDAAGNIVLGERGKQKGKPQPDTALRDTENVPLSEDVQAYFEREVLPHAPDAWIDHDKTRVGYRVKSPEGVRFRQWATRVLREHLTRGYTLDRRRFEASTRELDAALTLIRQAARSPELMLDASRASTTSALLRSHCSSPSPTRPARTRRSANHQHAGDAGGGGGMSAMPDSGFAEIVDLIVATRQRAVQTVNAALIDLYWQIGVIISRKTAAAEWGDGVVTQLAEHIACTQPGLRRFTRRNLFRMRQFHDA